MATTQQEASVPPPAGRKPEQLLPKTFEDTFNVTKGHFSLMLQRFQGCNQWTTGTLASVRKVMEEKSANSTIKSLPLTWIIVPLFKQLAPFWVQAQTQIIIMNATCWEGMNKEQRGMSWAEYARCELRRETPSTFTNYSVFPTYTFTLARATLKLVYRERSFS